MIEPHHGKTARDAKIDKLDARKKRQIMQLLDTFIANEKPQQKFEAKQLA